MGSRFRNCDRVPCDVDSCTSTAVKLRSANGSDDAGADKPTPRPRSASSYAMTGATSPALTERQSQRPVPFAVVDLPVPLLPAVFK